MSGKYEIRFAKSAALEKTLAVMLQIADQGAPAGLAEADPQGVSARAAGISGFKAKSMGTLELIAPGGSAADRLLLLGLGKPEALTANDWLRAGGAAAAQFKSSSNVVVFLDAPGLEVSARQAADFALGILLRGYTFDAYKTKKKDGEEGPKKRSVTLLVADEKAARKAGQRLR